MFVHYWMDNFVSAYKSVIDKLPGSCNAAITKFGLKQIFKIII